jgi:hypothetical protein
MDLIPSIVNAVVVAAVALILAWVGKGRFDALERRMDRHEAQNEARFEAMQASMDAMRSDLTQLAISFGQQPRAENT